MSSALLTAVPPLYSRRRAKAPNPAEGFRSAWTADELMAAEFPEPKWAVPGILSEGVNLLAGPPKVGKSWMALGLGLSVAAGGEAFGAVPVDGGPVLYLALEDTARRLQNRMGKLLGGRPAPSGLTLSTECPPLPQGGAEMIAGWLDQNTQARLVVIDVFAKVRGAAPIGASAYDADYAAVGHAKQLADHYGVSVVLVHHLRKASSDDWLTEVSGTNGMAGAADATLVLKRGRGQADGVLLVTGRDVEEAEHALSFQTDTGAWHLLDGPAEDHLIGDTRAVILRYVRANPGARPKQLSEATGIDVSLARKTCARMADDHQLRRGPGGAYYAPTREAGE
ncbi:AAA domain-containing protein [Streptomyces sp. Ag109_O5-1]|uniref:AAA family ATPase n=1 Tax=Streptomyces sp. Ag109_O5-1 TaxID=1938851 RepID=UPI000F4D6E97|nr:AAA family ATPase [Streptomyces sp. Ag109_O5-1]RPE39689.1 AAA domain-containing protein [Streptomyces sp. Ag109_O5-1]